MNGRPLVARTLDVGGDKPLPYWPVPKEDNPFLGLRGIRLALTEPEVLETQLRALLMAAGCRRKCPATAHHAAHGQGRGRVPRRQGDL